MEIDVTEEGWNPQVPCPLMSGLSDEVAWRCVVLKSINMMAI